MDRSPVMMGESARKLMESVGQNVAQRPQKLHCSAKYSQTIEAGSLVSKVIADGEQT
jgi:hypothetical protein